MTLIQESDPFGPWLFCKKEEPKTCWWCNWSGTLAECRWERVEASKTERMMLAGGDGYEFRCPKCNQYLTTKYQRQY